MPASSHEFSVLTVIIIIVAIGANAGLAFIPAYMARDKGYSFGAFWCISFFGLFLVGLIIAACISEKMPPYYAPPQYQLPYGQPPYGQPGQSAQFTSRCSNCGQVLANGDPFCPRCGNKVQ